MRFDSLSHDQDWATNDDGKYQKHNLDYSMYLFYQRSCFRQNILRAKHATYNNPFKATLRPQFLSYLSINFIDCYMNKYRCFLQALQVNMSVPWRKGKLSISIFQTIKYTVNHIHRIYKENLSCAALCNGCFCGLQLRNGNLSQAFVKGDGNSEVSNVGVPDVHTIHISPDGVKIQTISWRCKEYDFKIAKIHKQHWPSPPIYLLQAAEEALLSILFRHKLFFIKSTTAWKPFHRLFIWSCPFLNQDPSVSMCIWLNVPMLGQQLQLFADVFIHLLFF